MSMPYFYLLSKSMVLKSKLKSTERYKFVVYLDLSCFYSSFVFANILLSFENMVKICIKEKRLPYYYYYRQF